jgi:hypothetical protein
VDNAVLAARATSPGHSLRVAQDQLRGASDSLLKSIT